MIESPAAAKRERCDNAIAMDNINWLSGELHQKFGEKYKGLSVWGSVADHCFMLPVDVSGVNEKQIQIMRETQIPVRGESRGSDIDATIYVEKASMREIADYLGARIEDWDTSKRFEHLMIAPYDDVQRLFQKLQGQFAKGKQRHGLVQKIECLFVISRATQQRTGTFYPKRISETIVELVLGRPYFEAAFTGIKHGMVEPLVDALNLNQQALAFLVKKHQQEIQSDPKYYKVYLQKKKRFERLEEILKSTEIR